MTLLPDDIEDLIFAQKQLLHFPAWNADADRRYYVVVTPLTIGEITVGGFELRLKVSKRFVDRDAIAQLEWAASRQRRMGLWRIEWRPGGRHQNPAWGPAGHELEVIAGTHEHRFSDNWLASQSRLRAGNLPAARPIAPDPKGLNEFIETIGEIFRISDIGLVQMPPPQDMFWIPSG